MPRKQAKRVASSEPGEPRATDKGERTRSRILDTALALFRDEGFEATSMRKVAEQAGVSLGNAYYYFESKEHIVQAFYARSHAEHLAACEELLANERDLSKRLRGVLIAKIETAEPYHHFATLLFRTAADPKSPLNPFSGSSQPVRNEATALMERVLAGSSSKLPADLRERLPELLWLYEMSVILFWLHDESAGRTRTLRLIDRTVEIVTRLISVASFPLMKPLRKSALELVDDLKRAD